MKSKILIKHLLMSLLCLCTATALSAKKVEKLRVKSVHFEGNQDLSERQLRKVMLSRPSAFLNPVYYNSDIFLDDLKNIELFYRQNGYLEAQISDYHIQTDSTRRRIDITIKIAEGELTRIEGVEIFGNKIFSDKELLEKINIKTNDPFKRKSIEAANLALLRLYADRGYINAEIAPDIRINSELHKALINFNIQENTQFTIGQIQPIGIEKTKSTILFRELQFKSGDIINYSRLLSSQRKLYLTGLFQSVFIRPQFPASGDSAKKDIIIDVKENESIEFNVSLGYGTIEKIRSKLEVTNINWKGTARKIGINTKISFIGWGIEALFTEPWTFNTPWRTDMTITAEHREEPGYDFSRIKEQIIAGRVFQKWHKVNLTYHHELTSFSNIRVAEIPEQLNINLQILKLSLIYDTRDNLFNPKKGIYSELGNEFGSSFSAKLKNFFRCTGKVKYFCSLTPSSVLATSLDIGWIYIADGIHSIPLHERFYTGGPNSLRGFEYQRVGPLDIKRLPLGGRIKLVWNVLEVRQKLYKMVEGSLFFDTGNVWSKMSDVSLKSIRFSPGIGFRLDTPIGLVRIDYGINIVSKEGEEKGKLYFGIGQAF